jgi:ankyrin repeat protein
MAAQSLFVGGKNMDSTQTFIQSVKNGDMETILRWLEQDPTLVHSQTEQGVSVVMLAMYYGKPDVAKLLVSKGASLNIFEATATGQLARVQELVASDPNLVNATANDGFQPLGLASFFGHTTVVHFLLGQGAEANVASKNEQRVMPLHSAVAGQNLEIVQALLVAGADVNARQAGDFTPLHGAAENGQVEMVKLLLGHGADISARSDSGQTAREIGQAKGNQEIVELLQGSD